MLLCLLRVLLFNTISYFFGIVCFGFIVVPGVSYMFFLTDPLFVLYSMHFIPLLIVWCSVSP